MNVIGAGLAAYGMSGQVFHAPLLHMNPGFRIVSILERNKSISEGRYPKVEIVRDFKELLGNDQVGMVVVNTPDQYHYDMVKMALLAGKHVVVEKPFVQESKKGQELIQIAKDKALILSVFHNRRWDGDFLTIREILRKGLLGRLVEYEAHFDRYRSVIQQGSWKEDPTSGTGILFNLGSHLIDQAIVLFGSPDSVTADIRTQRSNGGIDDAFTLWLGYTDVKVTLKASYLVREPGPRYMLHGTLGSYIKKGIDPQEEQLKAGVWPDGPDWGIEPESEWGHLHTELEDGPYSGTYETIAGDYRQYYENLYAAINQTARLQVTARQANLVIKIIEAAMESHRRSRQILISD